MISASLAREAGFPLSYLRPGDLTGLLEGKKLDIYKKIDLLASRGGNCLRNIVNKLKFSVVHLCLLTRNKLKDVLLYHTRSCFQQACQSST